MRRLGDCRSLRALLSAALVIASMPLPSRFARADQAATATKPPSPTPASPTAIAGEPSATPSLTPVQIRESIDRARELIKTHEYDAAIETLTAVTHAAKIETGALREAYLLLIKTWVFYGADLEAGKNGRESAKLNYDRAKELIKECLSIKELRNTSPDPPSEYPEKMINLFTEVLGESFGSFRVLVLRPVDATVLLDGDTLRMLPGEKVLGEVHIPVGAHHVVVAAKGYKRRGETIQIQPGSIIEQSYSLGKRRSGAWYAGVSVAAAGVVAAAFAAGSAHHGSGAPPETPLPAAPSPPSR